MIGERRPNPLTRSATVLTVLVLCLGLAACAASASQTSSQTATASQPTATAALATPTTAPQPTPIPPGAFTTYTNTAYGYAILYPHNWNVEGATADSPSFIVFNYDPKTYQQPTTQPPLLKIEIDAVPNPNSLSALDLFKQTASGPGQPPATIISSQEIALAGHPSTQIIWSSAASSTPTITYLYTAPHATTTLFISQSNAVNGQSSPVFTQMLASLTISG